MNRLIASIAGIAFMTTASLAWADCESTCEANCLFLGDPGSIGLCIANCPASCQVTVPSCERNTNPNRCTVNSPIVVTADGPAGQVANGYTIRNDGTGGSPTAFMHLLCVNVGVFKNLVQGPVTVPFGSIRRACGSLGFAVNTTCGINATCNN